MKGSLAMSFLAIFRSSYFPASENPSQVLQMSNDPYACENHEVKCNLYFMYILVKMTDEI